jgi:hypothetical protein
MRKRRTSLAASLLGLTLSASALAQAPADGSAVESVFPAPRTEYIGSDSADGWNRDWQWRFSADAAYLKRNNSSNDIPVITGPEIFRFRDVDFDFQYGTRLSLGIMEDDYEFEVTFLMLKDWLDDRSGVLAHGLGFDGPTAFAAAAAGAQTAVDPGLDPNFLTSETYFSPLNSAASAALETDALDFLAPGASFQAQYRADFQDIEANYKQRSQPGRWLRYGFGFRNVKVREDGFAALSGTFGSVDADGIGAPGTAGLPSAALTGAGLTFATGGTDDGFIAGDSLLFSSRTLTENRLNGMQAIAEFQFLESDYFDLGGSTKAGVYYNSASGSISEQYAGSGSNSSIYTRSLTDEKSAVSFLGHAAVTGRLHLRRNIRVVAGYEAVYLAGLALAPDQAQAAATPVAGAASLNLRTDGTMFVHGGRLGLEILFP